MARTIQDSVNASGENVDKDELVNFGSCHRDVINPCTGPRSNWFRYGGIRSFTLPQVQAAIGEIASAGQPVGAIVMRVSDENVTAFTSRGTHSFFGLEEFSIDVPVVVKCSVEVA